MDDKLQSTATRFDELRVGGKIPTLPRTLQGGEWSGGHVQGIAIDRDRQYIYYSFTTVLVKTDMEGNLIGTVTGLTGHLGCLAFNGGDGRVWGSIEYKHDSIGQGIAQNIGVELADEDAFYIAIFDVEKIDRVGMDAEADGVMTAVYLPDVVEDFLGEGKNGESHRYGCSGIDGVTFAPAIGAPAVSPYMLYVAYGIYGTTTRDDNDHQVILEYDWRKLVSYARPLNQATPHHSGARCTEKYFVYTKNTNWGVQNLEYDTFLDCLLMSVYRGKKEGLRNPPMFIVDRTVPPVRRELAGLDGEEGYVLTLAPIGVVDEASGVIGCDFPKGQTGLFSLGKGYYYVSYEGRTDTPERLHTSTVRMCRYTGESPKLFQIVE